jgi:hypothetical protein
MIKGDRWWLETLYSWPLKKFLFLLIVS